MHLVVTVVLLYWICLSVCVSVCLSVCLCVCVCSIISLLKSIVAKWYDDMVSRDDAISNSLLTTLYRYLEVMDMFLEVGMMLLIH